MADGEKKLTSHQQRFILFYVGVSRFNATDAARRAGYKDPELEGWRLRQNEVIRARIDERLNAEALTSTEILGELRTTALAPTEHFMQMVKPEYTDENGYMHEAIIRLDYGAKMKALELLGKNKKIFVENLHVTGSLTWDDLARKANEDADTGGSGGDLPQE
jgi:phage terminase small subunit